MPAVLDFPFREPMLAPKQKPGEQLDIERLRYPLLGSIKYDGIRAIVTPKVELLSRRLRRIPNYYARSLFEHPALMYCDGELIAGPPDAPDCISRTQSAVMSEDTVDPELRFYVFDHFEHRNEPYVQRALLLASINFPEQVIFVQQDLVQNPDEARAFEERVVSQGYEGVMFRSLKGIYKCGRSTVDEQYLLKWKRHIEGEAVILEVEEMMHNDNVAMRDARGKTKRSKSKSGMRGAGMLGRAHVQDLETGVKFWIGSGPLLTLANRIALWKIKEQLPGLIWRYRCNPVVKEKPRNPRVHAFRNEADL